MTRAAGPPPPEAPAGGMATAAAAHHELAIPRLHHNLRSFPGLLGAAARPGGFRYFALGAAAPMALEGGFLPSQHLPAVQPSLAKSATARSEASHGASSDTGSGRGLAAPPPELSQLVRRKVSLPRQLFERLDAEEKAHRLLAQGPSGRCGSW